MLSPRRAQPANLGDGRGGWVQLGLDRDAADGRRDVRPAQRPGGAQQPASLHPVRQVPTLVSP